MFSRSSLNRFNRILKDRKHMKLGGETGECMRRKCRGRNGGVFDKTLL